MSERILKALIQLFAIVARVDNIGNDGRTVVKVFLTQSLNAELVETYLQLFDEYVEKHQKISKRKEGKERKRTSVNSVKVLRICSQINEELAQKQKMVVLLRLIEFVFSEEYSDQEIESKDGSISYKPIYSIMNNYNLMIFNSLSQQVFFSTINIQQFQIPVSTLGSSGTYVIQIFDSSNNLIKTKYLILN